MHASQSKILHLFRCKILSDVQIYFDVPIKNRIEKENDSKKFFFNSINPDIMEHPLLPFSTRQPGKAKVHFISHEEFENYIIESPADILEALSQIASTLPDLRKGDIVQLDWEVYRNEGSYIYNGTKVLQLIDDPDEHGTLPKEFQVPEFPPDYWTDIIVHNTYIWLNLEKLQPQIEQNIQLTSDVGYAHFYSENTPIQTNATWFNLGREVFWVIHDSKTPISGEQFLNILKDHNTEFYLGIPFEIGCDGHTDHFIFVSLPTEEVSC